MPVTPLYNKRALYVSEQRLVILADVHLGLEYELSLRGAQIPAQSTALIDAVCTILEETQAERLLVAGDLKHIIRPGSDSREFRQALHQERIDVSLFVRKISELTDITLIMGNHDGGMQHFGALTLLGATGTALSPEVSCIHGHAWPSADIMGARTLIMGHVHPVVQLCDDLGYTSSQTCWIRAPLDVVAAREVYHDINIHMEILVMPAFNPLCGGTAVNTQGLLGPMRTIINLAQAQVYLLDGTHLGVIEDL